MPKSKSTRTTGDKIIILFSMIAVLVLIGLISGLVISKKDYPVYSINGPSMSPDFKNGRRIITTKDVSDIQRGDVIIFSTTTLLSIIVTRSWLPFTLIGYIFWAFLSPSFALRLSSLGSRLIRPRFNPENNPDASRRKTITMYAIY